MSVWGPLEFGRGWQRIRTAVEAAMKADYTDQVVRPALGEWVDVDAITDDMAEWLADSRNVARSGV